MLKKTQKLKKNKFYKEIFKCQKLDNYDAVPSNPFDSSYPNPPTDNDD